MSQAFHQPLYVCKDIRAMEADAIHRLGIDESELMRRAGQEAFSLMCRLYPHVRHIALFCGAGNNAGDAYVLGLMALQAGFKVQWFVCADVKQYKSPAYQAFVAFDELYQASPSTPDDLIDDGVELIIDALLGIGFHGDVQGAMADYIDCINNSHAPVLSIDIPSGFHADTGIASRHCVVADHTVSFIAHKQGCFSGDGKDYCGKVHLACLGLSSRLMNLKPASFLMNPKVYQSNKLPFKHNSHKGDYGHVLVIGGDYGYFGAVILAAIACLRAGAGAVTVATRAEAIPAVIAACPDLMVHGVEDAADLALLFKRATHILIGPGLLEQDFGHAMFKTALAAGLPMLLDASALRLLAKYPQYDDQWILTPHVGEAMALAGLQTNTVDRFSLIDMLKKQYGGTIVLKGSGSMVATHHKAPVICAQGNPAMAVAGMGDVLSGIMMGLAARGYSLQDAALIGVFAHARCGDILAKEYGGRGILASDMHALIPSVINEMCS